MSMIFGKRTAPSAPGAGVVKSDDDGRKVVTQLRSGMVSLKDISDFIIPLLPPASPPESGEIDDDPTTWREYHSLAASYFNRKGSFNNDMVLERGCALTRRLVRAVVRAGWTESLLLHPMDPNFIVSFQEEGMPEPIPLRVNFKSDPAAPRFGCMCVRVSMTSVPTMTDMATPPWWREAFMEPELNSGGLVIIAGETGSGKTTLGYAMVRARLERFAGRAVFIEVPPEIPFGVLRFGQGIAIQSEPMQLLEVPTSVLARNSDGVVLDDPISGQPLYETRKEWVSPNVSLQAALSQVLRQFPASNGRKIVYVGEVRDGSSAGECVRLAKSGHLVVLTFHAEAVSVGLGRFLQLLENAGMTRDQAASDLSDVMRIFSFQRLIRSEDDVSKVHYEGDLLLFGDTGDVSSNGVRGQLSQVAKAGGEKSMVDIINRQAAKLGSEATQRRYAETDHESRAVAWKTVRNILTATNT